MPNKPYKLLIRGELVQQTAFSNGGNDAQSSLDMPLARDGQGRFTLRGSSLAGAFIATARELFDDLPEEISEGTPTEQLTKQAGKKVEELPRMKESVWIFHHAHPLKPQEPEIRDQVAISQKTGAARHTAKFDLEVLPAGTRWGFLLEVDRYRAASGRAATIAWHVAQAWRQRCWLGREVARGLGWMKLENLRCIELDASQVHLWPDAGLEPWEALGGLSVHEEPAFLNAETEQPKTGHQLHGRICIQVGEAENGYGLDMLSVGSYQEDKQRRRSQPEALVGKAFLKEQKEKLIKPLGMKSETYLEFPDSNSGDADFSLAVTRHAGNARPFIPGSSLRGALRHALSWLLRRRGEAVWEPGEPLPPEADDLPLKLFGSTGESACLLLSDAMMENDDWQAVVLEMHAEDEFTQGVYGSGKFDRSALTQGTFHADFHLQAGSGEELERLTKGLEQLRTLGENQRIPLGGGQWKGLGWVKLDIAWEQESGEKS